MTLEGTNTYVVAAPGSRTALVIDPGPLDPDHAARVTRASGGRQIELVLLTHAHVDHADGARDFAERAGAPLAALDPAWATTGPAARGELVRGRELTAGGVRLEPLPTPGHSADHCCFWLGAERARIYADVDPALHPAAQLSVRAHLAKLVREGCVAEVDGGFAPVREPPRR